MPTDRWIAEHYPPDFMADMLADVVGDFTAATTSNTDAYSGTSPSRKSPSCCTSPPS